MRGLYVLCHFISEDRHLFVIICFGAWAFLERVDDRGFL